jgi:hypothetical protein
VSREGLFCDIGIMQRYMSKKESHETRRQMRKRRGEGIPTPSNIDRPIGTGRFFGKMATGV